MLRWLNGMVTWWNGSTLGTRLWTRRNGTELGRDGGGNVYYATRDGLRRWCVYVGDNDASQTPPEWHAWLHHQVSRPPSEAALPVKAWEKPWVPNLTGTPDAYAPSGALTRTGVRARSTGDYEAWSPE